MENYFTYVDIKGELFDETKTFLKTLSPRRSQIMRKAIIDAEDGDSRMLNLVRQSRMEECTPLPNVKRKEFIIETPTHNISAALYQNSDIEDTNVLLIYAHGGGWTIGNIETCTDFCQKLAATKSVKVLAFDYRLAPEFKHPSALDDCESVWNWAIRNLSEIDINNHKIYIGGDSAGGHLAAALTDRLAIKNMRMPDGLILFYPVTTFEDVSQDNSWRNFGVGYALDSTLMDAFNDAYIPNLGERPKASPQNFATLSKFPPTLLMSSGHDILLNQDERFASRLADAGVKIRHVCLHPATHIYITMSGMPKCFDIALNETRAFIEKTRAQ